MICPSCGYCTHCGGRRYGLGWHQCPPLIPPPPIYWPPVVQPPIIVHHHSDRTAQAIRALSGR